MRRDVGRRCTSSEVEKADPARDQGGIFDLSDPDRAVDACFDEIRAGFFLLAGLAMLAMICAVAALGTVMRPLRWAEKGSAQF